MPRPEAGEMHFAAVIVAAAWLSFCAWSSFHLWKEQSLFGVVFMLALGVVPLYRLTS